MLELTMFQFLEIFENNAHVFGLSVAPAALKLTFIVAWPVVQNLSRLKVSRESSPLIATASGLLHECPGLEVTLRPAHIGSSPPANARRSGSNSAQIQTPHGNNKSGPVETEPLTRSASSWGPRRPFRWYLLLPRRCAHVLQIVMTLQFHPRTQNLNF